ncbi:Rad51-domain-containing protein [Suillus cothurnatus]|nr:Rad51-domain-containing protein [Suillus cothurnatus]
MSQSISEVYGEFRTGKTQLAHTMSVVTQLPPEMGAASGKVAYIDTEGTFRLDRIRSIAERFGVDGNMALENILYARAFNSEHQVAPLLYCYAAIVNMLQMELISECSLRFAEDKDFRLLVGLAISVAKILFTQQPDRGLHYGSLSRRSLWSWGTQRKATEGRSLSLRCRMLRLTTVQLAQVMSKLTKLSEEFNITVLITNQVQSDPGATMTFVAGGALKPIGGHILSHSSATRMFLRKGRAEERVAKLVDSPDRPESEVSYKLDEGGWTDV